MDYTKVLMVVVTAAAILLGVGVSVIMKKKSRGKSNISFSKKLRKS